MLTVIKGTRHIEQELVAALFEPAANGRAKKILASMDRRGDLKIASAPAQSAPVPDEQELPHPTGEGQA